MFFQPMVQQFGGDLDDLVEALAFAEAEQLTAHANSIKVRFEGEE